MTEKSPEVLLPEHFGFCEGVVAADDLLRDTLQIAKGEFGIEQVYGYHDIVHNQSVREEHEQNGAIFVDSPHGVPERSIVVPSAHGSSPSIHYELAKKECLVLDAVCPLVEHTHKMVQRARRDGENILYVTGTTPGERVHDEVQGTLGHMSYYLDEAGELIYSPIPYRLINLANNPDIIAREVKRWSNNNLRIITQTTLDADACFDFRERLTAAIKERDPQANVAVSAIGDVCKAVRRRRAGVDDVLLQLQKRDKSGLMVTVTDPESKNGKGYHEQAKRTIQDYGLGNVQPIAIARAAELPDNVQDAYGVVGVTASASTPDKDVIEVLSKLGVDEATLEFHRPKFSLYHGNGMNLRNPNNIRQIIKAWQEAS